MFLSLKKSEREGNTARLEEMMSYQELWNVGFKYIKYYGTNYMIKISDRKVELYRGNSSDKSYVVDGIYWKRVRHSRQP